MHDVWLVTEFSLSDSHTTVFSGEHDGDTRILKKTIFEILF
jgi:hypothetical protein